VLLRRFSEDLVIDDVPSPALAGELLVRHPAAFVAMAAAGPDAALELANLQRRFPAAGFAALMDDADPTAELAWYEAGAQLVVTSLFDLPPVIRMARRHGESVAFPRLGFEESLQAKMPWSGAYRGGRESLANRGF
jgi:hypothetical protein